MLTKNDKELLPTLDGGSSRRRATRVIAVAVLSLFGLAAVFLAGYRLNRPETYGNAILSPHANPEGASLQAIALVTGLTRKLDGLTFGE